MTNTLDYYQLLHVRPDAPAEIIKASYRALMQALKQHPDLGGDHDQAALINEAYATLTNADKRKAYDAQRLAAEDQAGAGSADTHPGATRRDRAKQPRPQRRCAFCGQSHTKADADGEVDAEARCERCACPLRPSMRIAAHGAGQRAIERYPRNAPVQLWTRWDASIIEGVSLDVSLRGMLIETATEFYAAQLIKINCELCHAVGKVVHLRETDNGWQVGIEFQTLRFVRARGAFISTQA